MNATPRVNRKSDLVRLLRSDPLYYARPDMAASIAEEVWDRWGPCYWHSDKCRAAGCFSGWDEPCTFVCRERGCMKESPKPAGFCSDHSPLAAHTESVQEATRDGD